MDAVLVGEALAVGVTLRVELAVLVLVGERLGVRVGLTVEVEV